MKKLGSQLTDDLAQVIPGVTLERVVRLRQDPFVHVVQMERHVAAPVVARVVAHLGVFTRMAARGVSLQRRGYPQDPGRSLQAPGPAVEPPANHSWAAPGTNIGVVGINAANDTRRRRPASDDETQHEQKQNPHRGEGASCWPERIAHFEGRGRGREQKAKAEGCPRRGEGREQSCGKALILMRSLCL